jgi:uncharacterized protein YndB with AHSA1/START domain
MSAVSPHGDVTTTEREASVRFERTIAAPIERVWRALTEPDDLAIWLERTSLDGRVGGAVEIAFDDGPVTGEITAWDPPHALEYTWIIEGEQPSVVRFELTTIGDATMLALHHVRLPRSMNSGYAAGWHAHLDQLEDRLGDRPVRPWSERFDAVLPDYRRSQAG